MFYSTELSSLKPRLCRIWRSMRSGRRHLSRRLNQLYSIFCEYLMLIGGLTVCTAHARLYFSGLCRFANFIAYSIVFLLCFSSTRPMDLSGSFLIGARRKKKRKQLPPPLLLLLPLLSRLRPWLTTKACQILNLYSSQCVRGFKCFTALLSFSAYDLFPLAKNFTCFEVEATGANASIINYNPALKWNP